MDSGTNENVIIRPLANFPRCIWADRFKSITVDEKGLEARAKEIEERKGEVASLLTMIREGTTNEKLVLIDSVERLGISYHFKDEIESLLEEIYLQNANSDHDNQSDLSTTALMFRLLRQHGFNISSGIFDQFLNENGHFKECLSKDEKGVLSLYEAAHLRTHGESILEEALAFSTTHLEAIAKSTSSPSLAKQVNHALERPLHRGTPQIEARHYMSVYEEDESKSPLLLKFAKLNYSYLQLLYRKELLGLLRWYEDLKFESRFPYSRDRLVEGYFWVTGCLSEPQFSLSRILTIKMFVCITVVDDTYDAYGTLDELKAFTDALQRWNVNEMDGLPKYMKELYIEIINLYEWTEQELTKQGISRPYALSSYKEENIQYAIASFRQSVWFLTRELPAFQDYKDNSVITSICPLFQPPVFIFMECGTETVFDWLAKRPKIIVAASYITRFLNDTGSHEAEKKRGGTGLECYMNHYNVSEDEAKKKYVEIAEDAWKDINEELLRPTVMPREVLQRVLDLSRVQDCLYSNHLDRYTNPTQGLEHHITALLLDLI